MFFSQRMGCVQPSPTLAISARAKELQAAGHDIIDLSVGETDFDTPDEVQSAAIQAIKMGKTRYTAVGGTPELQAAIVEKFKRENGLAFSPRNIMVSCGAKQAIFNALFATLDPGDEVIIPAPYWVSYPDMVAMVGGTPQIVTCPNFKITPNLLQKAITPRTKWLILNSPSNPTGAVYSSDELAALADVLRAYPHVWVLSDDIYEHLLYDGLAFHTFAMVAPDLAERTLTINGVSKAYAMTGWRIGYAAGPEPLIQAMTTLQSQSTSNPCSISQSAAVAALSAEGSSGLRERAQVFQERRDVFIKALGCDIQEGCSASSSLPFRMLQKPQGAFYLYVSCAAFIGKQTPDGKHLQTDADVATYLLDSAQVSTVPGSAFGLSPYLRLSYAIGAERLHRAAERMRDAFDALF